MYIINPFYIYLIDQLDKIEFVLLMISAILAFGSLCVFLYMNDDDSGYNVFLRRKKDDIRNITEALNEAKFKSNLLSQSVSKLNNIFGISNKQDCGSGFISIKIKTDINLSEFKSTISDMQETLDMFKQDQKEIQECIDRYQKDTPSYDAKMHLKRALIALVIFISLFTFLPSKETGYKILFASLITVENVTNAGQITSDIANGIVDKITESIIKIQNSK